MWVGWRRKGEKALRAQEGKRRGKVGGRQWHRFLSTPSSSLLLFFSSQVCLSGEEMCCTGWCDKRKGEECYVECFKTQVMGVSE